MERELDVIVWGATGFTGRLVCAHLASTHGVGKTVRWGLAGRNPDSLAGVRDSLGQSAAKLPLIVADATDVDSLREMVARTRVVASTVGPYSLYGNELVAACAASGTHYCDLAGEVPWLRRMIDAHQRTAEDSGATLVPSCGFDSIPSDLGVWFLQSEARARFGAPLQRIHLLVRRMHGQFSGGTAASLLTVAREAAGNPRMLRLLGDPYALNPRGRRGDDRREAMLFSRDEMTGEWIAPFVMAAINTRVVRRTNALLGYPYGHDFRYDEFVATGPGIGGAARAAALSGATAGAMVGAALPPTRFLMRRLLPAPGNGPDEETRTRGHFTLELRGMTSTGDALHAHVTGDRDPGYGATSRMLGEAAVCLAEMKNGPAGFGTPASALGAPLIERLRTHAGMTFSVGDPAATEETTD